MDSKTLTEAAFLGDQAPLLASRHEKQPEKRQISSRWLVSAFVVGVTSLMLMGGALVAALEGREQLTVTAKILDTSSDSDDALAPRGNHPGLSAKMRGQRDDVMMVSTLIREGDRNVVRQKPFLNISAPLASDPGNIPDYPKFNALRVFSESGKETIVAKSDANIYGADVQGEIALDFMPFPYQQTAGKILRQQSQQHVMQQVMTLADDLGSGGEYVSALSYFNADRFENAQPELAGTGDFTITAENVSVLLRNNPFKYSGDRYEERTINIRSSATISAILQQNDLPLSEAINIENFLASDLGTNTVRTGDKLHVWFHHPADEQNRKDSAVARISVYRGTTHLVTMARTDSDTIVYSKPPKLLEELLTAQPQGPQIQFENMPTAYDAIYRTALGKGMTTDLADSLIRILAFDVDFKSRITPDDSLELFLSLEDGEQKPTDASEILYAGITIGKLKRKYYRYRDPNTGIVDFYDESGKSAKKFLLRQPVPNSKFRSPFGMRRHPISGIRKLHAGVDWAAPRGTPILAAGGGVVEKAAWAGGSGRRTIIRHANGYETYYLHQTRFAKGIAPGVRVRQGQIIGYVGSTGYSTGPHLHYEVHVNGRAVDPMRIRLPKGRVLKGEELIAFETERDRIDSLLEKNNSSRQLALN